MAEKIAAAKAAAAVEGRTFSYGIRLHVIVRETEEEAWAAADSLIKYVDEEAIATAQKAFSKFDSVGQQRMSRLHGGRKDKLTISPQPVGWRRPRAWRGGYGARR